MSSRALRVVSLDVSTGAEWRLSSLSVLRIVIALLVIANLGRVPVLSTGDREAPLMLNDVCMMLIVLLGAVAGVVRGTFRIDRLTTLAMLLSCIGLYSAILSIPRYGLTPFQLLISLAYLARWVTYFGLYVVVINLIRSADVMKVWWALERAMMVFAAFGIFQSLFIPHFAQVVYPNSRIITDFDEQGHRLVSTVLEPNIAGAMIMLVLLVQIAQLVAGERLAYWKPSLMFSALVATLSRSSFLGLFVGVAIILAVRGVSRRLLRVLAVTALLAAVAAPKALQFAASYNKLTVDASALSRVAAWIRALRIFSDHPILGIGFNTYAFVQERYGYIRLGNGSYSVDGGLLFVAVMTGLTGLAVYLGMLSVVIARCKGVWRSVVAPPEWRALSTGIAAATVALCVHSLFVNSLLTSFVMEPLNLLWALSFLMARGIVPDGAPAPRVLPMAVAQST
ncbi:hypothetical protein BH09GEM1_BH09GEM1_04760 [soil metagenome]